MNWKQWGFVKDLLGFIFFAGILAFFVYTAFVIVTNINENQSIAKETKDVFCPEGRTYEGLFDVKSYCKGKEYTCSIEECYWITEEQEKT